MRSPLAQPQWAGHQKICSIMMINARANSTRHCTTRHIKTLWNQLHHPRPNIAPNPCKCNWPLRSIKQRLHERWYFFYRNFALVRPPARWDARAFTHSRKRKSNRPFFSSLFSNQIFYFSNSNCNLKMFVEFHGGIAKPLNLLSFAYCGVRCA